MSRLKVLYFNVDTLYPNIWTAELEREVLRPLVDLLRVPEMHVIVRWVRPKDSDSEWFENETGRVLVRGDEVDEADEKVRRSPAGDMRSWIIDKVRMLEGGGL